MELLDIPLLHTKWNEAIALLPAGQIHELDQKSAYWRDTLKMVGVDIEKQEHRDLVSGLIACIGYIFLQNSQPRAAAMCNYWLMMDSNIDKQRLPITHA